MNAPEIIGALSVEQSVLQDVLADLAHDNEMARREKARAEFLKVRCPECLGRGLVFIRKYSNATEWCPSCCGSGRKR